jgi:hypothetical protein
VATSRSFKDFEKKTLDVWDIDEDDLIENSIDYSLPISISDSEEVAKKVIQNHKENKKLLNNNKGPTNQSEKVKSPIITRKTSFNNGPGKALRQENHQTTASKSKLNNNIETEANNSDVSVVGAGDSLTSSLASISLDKPTNSQIINKQIPNVSPRLAHQLHHPGQAKSATSKDLTSSNVASNSSKATPHNVKNHPAIGFSNQVPPIDINSNKNANNEGRAYSPYSYPLNRELEEDSVKCEKFRKILSNNPINLEELQKASWKGIPKTYRPICWKILSDYLPLKIELQEKTIEQKRNAYWESVTVHYSPHYIESHHEILRQVDPLLPFLLQNST